MVSAALEHSWLARHFGFDLPALVNFVGGGGKTSLILSLIEDYAETCSVLYTTTTRIHPPPLSGGLAVISSNNTSLLKDLLHRTGVRFHEEKCRLAATRQAVGPGLLGGVEPDFAASLDRDDFPLILNEADGARSMSIKMPRPGEPVLMLGAQYLVPVVGLDCLNRPLGPDTVFRWELAAKQISLQAGQPLTPELAASIVCHREGICKDWKPGMRIVVFVNKVDAPTQDALALALARELLQNRNFPVERVIWGSLLEKRADSLSSHRQ